MNVRGIITCLIILALAGPVLADMTGGRLVAVKGKVWTRTPGEAEVRARAGKTLLNGTQIRTGDNGRAEVVFEDGSIIVVHSNTTLVTSGIERRQVKKRSILLFFGRVWNKVAAAVGPKTSYEVNTPVVVCGVRGTEFETAAGLDGAALVTVGKGEVAVAGNGKEETLKRNQMVEADPETGLGKSSKLDRKIDWKKWHEQRRENLRKNGKQLVDQFRKRIKRQKDRLQDLRNRQKKVEKKYGRALKKARTGDQDAIEQVEKLKAALTLLGDQMADLGHVAACRFGLVDQFASLAANPRFGMADRRYVEKQARKIRRGKPKLDRMIKKGRDRSKKAGDKKPEGTPGLEESSGKSSPSRSMKKGLKSGQDRLDASGKKGDSKSRVTVSRVEYDGKSSKSPRSVSKGMTGKQPGRAGIKLTPLSTGSRPYKPGSMVPVQVAVEAAVVPDLIFEFQRHDGKFWRRLGRQRLSGPKTSKRNGKITQHYHIRLTEPGKYRWRCSANKGRSWSVWSKPVTVIQQGRMKTPVRGNKTTPLKNRTIKPGNEEIRITPTSPVKK